jgi:hypothetical protein
MRSPTAPEIKPLNGDLPARVTVTESPKTARAKYSGALKRRANLAKIGAKKVRKSGEGDGCPKVGKDHQHLLSHE